MEKTIAEDSYVMQKIRKYAKAQLISWETLQTAVMLMLIAFFAYVIKGFGHISIYMWILIVSFGAIALFGIYETVPAVIMLAAPYSSSVFPRGKSRAEKEEMVKALDEAADNKKCRLFLDMTAADDCALLEGMRDLRLIRWQDIERVTKKEYPFRKKYKGIYFLNFIDNNGHKYELDIHNGKPYNPLKQVDQIVMYIENNHPHIKVEITDADRERMNERSSVKNKEKEEVKTDKKAADKEA